MIHIDKHKIVITMRSFAVSWCEELIYSVTKVPSAMRRYVAFKLFLQKPDGSLKQTIADKHDRIHDEPHCLFSAGVTPAKAPSKDTIVTFMR